LFGNEFLGANEAMVLLAIFAFIGLIGGLAIFAMIRVFGISMLGLPRNSHLESGSEKADRLMTYPIFVLVFALLGLGIFAKPLLAWLIGSANLLTLPASSVVTTGAFSSMAAFLAVVGFFILVVIFRKSASTEIADREYHTWDCGQPINASMEYTATAFSAPIRFFFLRFLGSNKMVKSEPVVATNPWIRKYVFSLTLTSIWKEKLYAPLADVFMVAAERVKKIQSGRVQYYLVFLLITLIVTLIIAL
jgi:hydrogenase-4 component B